MSKKKTAEQNAESSKAEISGAEYWGEVSDQFIQELTLMHDFVNGKACQRVYHPYAIEKEDTTVQFRIKECPDWIFGVWWGYSENLSPLDCLEGMLDGMWEGYGEFFCAHSYGSEKFKPQRARFKGTVYLRKNVIDGSRYEFDMFAVLRNISFIAQEPDLAFCRDIMSYDYNQEYLSRSAANKLVRKFFRNRRIEKELKERYVKEMQKITASSTLGSLNDLIMVEQPADDYDLMLDSAYYFVVPYETNQQAFGFMGPDSYSLERWFAQVTADYEELLEKTAKKTCQLDERYDGIENFYDYPEIIRVMSRKDFDEFVKSVTQGEDGIYRQVQSTERE